MATIGVRAKRLELATRFLDEEILPGIEAGKIQTLEDLHGPYLNFQTDNLVEGVTWNFYQVWAVTLKRVLQVSSGTDLGNLKHLEKALELVEEKVVDNTD